MDIADIVRAHRGALESILRLTREQKRVLTDIAQCRTAVLGGHMDRCARCGYEHPAYNSCRNRHCPKCQALAQEQWIEARRARMLDTRHFHVVFTLPAELRPLAAFAPRVVYGALFAAAQRTLLEFGRRRLQAAIGATLVLHTWTRELALPSRTCTPSSPPGDDRLTRARWCPTPPALSVPRRSPWAASSRQDAAQPSTTRTARTTSTGFDDFAHPEGFARLMQRAAKPSWNVYAKAPFDKGRHVLDYLGRYTHRVGIANSRLSP